MLTKTRFLAITLGLTALASATVPAAAKPSQHLGGAKLSLPAAAPAIPASAGLRPGGQVLHLPTSTATSTPAAGPHPVPLKVGSAAGSSPAPVGSTGSIAGTKPSPLKVPMGTGTGTVGVAGTTPSPLKVPMPPYSGGVDNVCPFNGSKCPTPTGGNQAQPSGGGIVITAPGASVQVPVPVTVPMPVTTGAGAAYAQARPGAQGCRSNIPPLAAAIDELMPTVQLSSVDMTRVAVMRDLIQQLASTGKEASARDVEEVAMSILGYKKIWLRCGYGTFTWINLAGNTATNPAQ